jgi:hypothetical protein
MALPCASCCATQLAYCRSAFVAAFFVQLNASLGVVADGHQGSLQTIPSLHACLTFLASITFDDGYDLRQCEGRLLLLNLGKLAC